MHPGRLIRGQTRNYGPLLQLPCPDCDKEQWFHLKEHSSGVDLLVRQVDHHCSFSLHCEKCEYPVDLQTEDAQKAVLLLPVSQAFLNGALDESGFKVALHRAEFDFLMEIEAANTNWTCPKCGEESPLTFETCWNCGQSNEALM